ncbi:MAG: helix-turn-helix domain-containing protein [Proteobacteria bacterium]|jgi:transcriptional regulator with XRE-family HTH domain|nr:helix-turn-helix domain-containing protein [Pseudomonadota bacterium]
MKNADEAKRVLGRSIALLRKREGLTQSELAEKLEVSDNFVGQIERGQNAPSLENLVRIANTLKVEVGELFGGKSTPVVSELPLKLEREIDSLILLLKDQSLADVRFLKKFAKLLFQEFQGRR